MKKNASSAVLIYYLFLWVVMPHLALESNYPSNIEKKQGGYTFSHSAGHHLAMQEAVLPDWSIFSTQNFHVNHYFQTGHWPVLFAEVAIPDFEMVEMGFLNPFFSEFPIWGSLSPPQIIFPFHYFW